MRVFRLSARVSESDGILLKINIDRFNERLQSLGFKEIEKEENQLGAKYELYAPNRGAYLILDSNNGGRLNDIPKGSWLAKEYGLPDNCHYYELWLYARLLAEDTALLEDLRKEFASSFISPTAFPPEIRFYEEK